MGRRSRSESPTSDSPPRSRRKRERKSAWDLGGEPPSGGAQSPPTGGGYQSSPSSFNPMPPQNPAENFMAAQFMQQPQHQPAGMALNDAMGKKRRELFIGNLSVGQVTEPMLREVFTTLLAKLPEYQAEFSHLASPIVAVRTSSDGKFAFMEFANEKLTSTALQFNQTELRGRQMKLGRPKEYSTPPDGDAYALDTSALKTMGLIGPGTSADALLGGSAGAVAVSVGGGGGYGAPAGMQMPPAGGGGTNRVKRELYVGNLPEGITPEVIRDTLTPDLLRVVDPMECPPIVKVNLGNNNRYAFVELRTEQICTIAINMFSKNTYILGKNIRVARPSNYKEQTGEDPPPVEHMERPQTPPTWAGYQYGGYGGYGDWSGYAAWGAGGPMGWTPAPSYGGQAGGNGAPQAPAAAGYNPYAGYPPQTPQPGFPAAGGYPMPGQDWSQNLPTDPAPGMEPGD